MLWRWDEMGLAKVQEPHYCIKWANFTQASEQVLATVVRR